MQLLIMLIMCEFYLQIISFYTFLFNNLTQYQCIFKIIFNYNII